MLPMGTIMATTMFVGVIFVHRLPGLTLQSRMPGLLQKIVGGFVTAGGLWNVFWYSLQHLTEFWGQMALVSGVLMLITGVTLMRASLLPVALQKLRPATTLGLLVCGVIYALKIYSL